MGFPFTTQSRVALGPNQIPAELVPGGISLEVREPERETYALPASIIEIKKPRNIRCISYVPTEKCSYLAFTGAHDGAVGWGTALQAGRSRFQFPMVSLEYALT
jgi:hypothetical protein